MSAELPGRAKGRHTYTVVLLHSKQVSDSDCRNTCTETGLIREQRHSRELETKAGRGGLGRGRGGEERTRPEMNGWISFAEIAGYVI